MAAFIPYVLPAVVGGALGSAQARAQDGRGARWRGFLKGALAGAGAAYGANKMGFNPFSSATGAPVPPGAGGLSFNPMSFMDTESNRINPEPKDIPQLQPLVPPNYLPPMQY